MLTWYRFKLTLRKNSSCSKMFFMIMNLYLGKITVRVQWFAFSIFIAIVVVDENTACSIVVRSYCSSGVNILLLIIPGQIFWFWQSQCWWRLWILRRRATLTHFFKISISVTKKQNDVIHFPTDYSRRNTV